MSSLARNLQCEALDLCLQRLGGSGYIQEALVAPGWFGASVTLIAEGAVDVMQEVIGRRLFEVVGR